MGIFDETMLACKNNNNYEDTYYMLIFCKNKIESLSYTDVPISLKEVFLDDNNNNNNNNNYTKRFH